MGAWAKSARLRSEKAKDVAAGSVLVCAIGAAIVRALVLGPPLAALMMK
jgi:diacylglycerol kinase